MYFLCCGDIRTHRKLLFLKLAVVIEACFLALAKGLLMELYAKSLFYCRFCTINEGLTSLGSREIKFTFQ